MKITFIGGGNMAVALISGLYRQGLAAANIDVVEPSTVAGDALVGRFGVRCTTAVDATALAAQIIVLSDARVVTAAGPREVLLEARAQMARGVRFDTVVAGPDANRDLLTALAAESGGRVGELP